MSRIRTIKPEFWTDDLIGSLSRETRLLFIASWNLADDEGRLRWSAPYLKGAVFPFDDDIQVGEVEAMMAAVQDAGLVIAYVGGRSQQRLGFIRNFAKHQRINRPSVSKLPPPPDERGSDPPVNRAETSSPRNSVNRTWIDSDTPSLLEGEEEREGEEDTSSLRSDDVRAPALAAPVEVSAFPQSARPNGNDVWLKRADFAAFWAKYPHKVDKGHAERTFDRLVKTKTVTLDALLAGIERYRRSKPPDRSWCNPSTFLNGKRWLDEDSSSTGSLGLVWAQTA